MRATGFLTTTVMFSVPRVFPVILAGTTDTYDVVCRYKKKMTVKITYSQAKSFNICIKTITINVKKELIFLWYGSKLTI